MYIFKIVINILLNFKHNNLHIHEIGDRRTKGCSCNVLYKFMKIILHSYFLP